MLSSLVISPCPGHDRLSPQLSVPLTSKEPSSSSLKSSNGAFEAFAFSADPGAVKEETSWLVMVTGSHDKNDKTITHVNDGEVDDGPRATRWTTDACGWWWRNRIKTLLLCVALF
jgi:hypothetical protein